MNVELRHGGNRAAMARSLGCSAGGLLDASASLVPWTVTPWLWPWMAWRDYPDRDQLCLRRLIASLHGLDVAAVLPGNGAAELFP